VNVNTPSMFRWSYPEELYQYYDQALCCEGSQATIRFLRGPRDTKRSRTTGGKFAGDVKSRCNDPSIPSRTAIRNRAKAKHRAPLCGINSEVLDGGDCASAAMLLVDVHAADTVLAFDEGQGERRGLTGRRKQSEAGWDSWAVMARAAKNSVGIDLTDGSRFKRVAAVRHRGRRQAGSSAPEEICFLVLSLDRTLKHRRLVRTVLTKAADDAAREDVARHLVHRLRQVRGAAPAAAGLTPGLAVKVHGLTGTVRHNGATGLALRWLAEKSRWEVRLGAGLDARTIAVKSANLRPLAQPRKPVRLGRLQDFAETPLDERGTYGLRHDHVRGFPRGLRASTSPSCHFQAPLLLPLVLLHTK
jgi:hypothetical protein